MNIKEKAMLFAIKAHMGQVRKNEPDKPMIIHPLGVGKLLEEYGIDDNTVAAAYLHDVVEDTSYTLDDIKREFGEEIAFLVDTASEPDKNLSWEERKQHTIDTIKTMPLNNKLVSCADKINNLEDLKNKFDKTGKEDFSLFKRGFNEQKWYYENVYNSLIYNEDINHPLFIRLKNVIDLVFNKKRENEYLEDVVFENTGDRYQTLKQLHAKKTEIQRIKKIIDGNIPFIIEFTGTPRTGKTTLINNLYDFFKKGGFKVCLIEEFTNSSYYKEEFYNSIKDLSKYEINIKIAKKIEEQLDEVLNLNYDVILIDRSLFDRVVWMNRLLKNNQMNIEQYNEYINYYKDKISKYIDIIVMLYADSLSSLKRDYHNSLTLEDRRFLNIENIEQYNEAMQISEKELTDLNSVFKVDTSNINQNESSYMVSDKVLSKMRNKYIKTLNNQINNKV